MSMFFTDSQLELVRSIAEACTEYDEHGAALQQDGDAIAVWNTLNMTGTGGWEPEQINVIRFAAEQCERQHDSAMSVYDYCVAWDVAVCHQDARMKLDLELLETLGLLLVPGSRVRRVGQQVTAGGGIVIGSAGADVEHDLEQFEALLLAFQLEGEFEHLGKRYTAQLLYETFERIHPRTDGNGRLGLLIFNWLNGTLTCPVAASEPSDFIYQ